MSSKVAIITGAGSGIGRSVALALLKDGFKVSIAGRRKEALEETAKQAPDQSNVLIVPTDVSQPNSVKELFTATKDEFGSVDVLFNNAGFGIPGAVEDLTRRALKEQFETNLFGPFELIHKILPIMRRQGFGRIIQNSSVLGMVALPFRGAYNSSKFAMEGLTDTLRL